MRLERSSILLTIWVRHARQSSSNPRAKQSHWSTKTSNWYTTATAPVHLPSSTFMVGPAAEPYGPIKDRCTPAIVRSFLIFPDTERATSLRSTMITNSCEKRQSSSRLRRRLTCSARSAQHGWYCCHDVLVAVSRYSDWHRLSRFILASAGVLPDQRRKSRLLQWRSNDLNFQAKIEDLLTTATSGATRKAVLSTMLTTPAHVRSSAVSAGSHSHAVPWEKTSHIPALHLAVQGAWHDGYWKHHLPKLEIREFAGLSHFLHMDDPETINLAIEGFVVKSKHLK